MYGKVESNLLDNFSTPTLKTLLSGVPWFWLELWLFLLDSPQTTKYYCQNFSIKNIYISILRPPFWPLKSQRSRNFLLFPQLFWLKKSFLSVSTFDILFGKISTFFKDSAAFIFMWNILQKYTFKYLVIQNILQTTMKK